MTDYPSGRKFTTSDIVPESYFDKHDLGTTVLRCVAGGAWRLLAERDRQRASRRQDE
jgi:hypothetical protein